jgi:hypothetical protein
LFGTHTSTGTKVSSMRTPPRPGSSLGDGGSGGAGDHGTGNN